MQNVFQPLSITRLLITVYLSFTFVACSSSQKVNDKNNNIYQSMKLAKVSGEGRGRVGVNSSRYLFNFASQAESSDNWILELDFALHGTEYLQYKWEPSKWSVSGSFLGALREFTKKSSKNSINEQQLNELLSFLSEALKTILIVNNNKKYPKCLGTGFCPVPKNKMTIEWQSDHKKIKASAVSPSSSNPLVYSLSFSNLKSGKYKLTSLKVLSKKGFKDKELLSLNLYFD